MRLSRWSVLLFLSALTVPAETSAPAGERTVGSLELKLAMAEPLPTEDDLAGDEEGVELAKQILKLCNEQKILRQQKLDRLIEGRKNLEHRLEQNIPEAMKSLKKEKLTVCKAEEQAAREGLAATESECVAAVAEVAYAEDDLAVTRAKRKVATEPGKEAEDALAAARKRLSKSRLKVAATEESAAEAKVKAAEAELATAKAKLEAARAESTRVRAEEQAPIP